MTEMTWADDDGTAHREGCDGAEECTGCAVTILDAEAPHPPDPGERLHPAASTLPVSGVR